MNQTLVESLLSVLRALLSTGAGYLVGKGYLNADIASSLVGLMMVCAPMAWGVYQKYLAAEALKEAAKREVWTEEQRNERNNVGR